MRRFLIGLLALEALALVALGAGVAFGAFDGMRRARPKLPVFAPAIYGAAMGDLARYERRERNPDGSDGTLLGYLEYRVERAVEYKNSTRGREFVIEMRQLDERGRLQTSRKIAVLPRTLAHGFLPPRYEESDDYPVGERPVIATLTSETFVHRGRDRDGFRLDIVLPRRSLTEVAERMWVTPKTAVFGVVRWERDKDVLLLHNQEQPGR